LSSTGKIIIEMLMKTINFKLYLIFVGFCIVFFNVESIYFINLLNDIKVK